MGPGCFHPRNGSSGGNTTLNITGFNGAGMFPSQKWASAYAPGAHPVGLQWGRDVSIPEITSNISRALPNCVASMGPGCFHPRNIIKAQVVDLQANWLQWGRDVSIPEIMYPSAVTQCPHWLQWGRDVSIPEIVHRGRRCNLLRRFNGAGMFPSQK